MLTGKQRSYLRGKANKFDPIIHVGKDGVTEGLIEQVDESLESHELIKGRVLKNALEETKEVVYEIAERCEADVVQVIGYVFILFRRNEEEPIYNLP